MSAAGPFAVAVAPNGARRTKADHPRLPMSAAEVARDAAGAREAGAAMIHLHVRDRDGRHTLDVDLYREAIAAVRAAIGDDMVVQVTTEAVGRYAPPQQIAVVDALQPESVSIALREILPEGGDETAAAALFERMERAGILHQIIVYDAAELDRLAALSARGVLPDGPLAVLAVLGRYSDTGATQRELDAFVDAGIARHQWMLCAFGPDEAGFMSQAARAGGHARVGFENNLWLPGGELAPDNASIVAATIRLASTRRGVANAAELRRLWRVPSSMQTAGRAEQESPDGEHGASGRSSNRPQGNVHNKETQT